MRRGIGLRGYGGIDPLNEFKREAFKLYEEFRGFISKQVANTIFRVQVNPAAGPPPRPGTPPLPRRPRPRRRDHHLVERRRQRDRHFGAAGGRRCRGSSRSRFGRGAARCDPVPARRRAGGQLSLGRRPRQVPAAAPRRAPSSAATIPAIAVAARSTSAATERDRPAIPPAWITSRAWTTSPASTCSSDCRSVSCRTASSTRTSGRPSCARSLSTHTRRRPRLPTARAI